MRLAMLCGGVDGRGGHAADVHVEPGARGRRRQHGVAQAVHQVLGRGVLRAGGRHHGEHRGRRRPGSRRAGVTAATPEVEPQRARHLLQRLLAAAGRQLRDHQQRAVRPGAERRRLHVVRRAGWTCSRGCCRRPGSRTGRRGTAPRGASRSATPASAGDDAVPLDEAAPAEPAAGRLDVPADGDRRPVGAAEREPQPVDVAAQVAEQGGEERHAREQHDDDGEDRDERGAAHERQAHREQARACSRPPCCRRPSRRGPRCRASRRWRPARRGRRRATRGTGSPSAARSRCRCRCPSSWPARSTSPARR